MQCRTYCNWWLSSSLRDRRSRERERLHWGNSRKHRKIWWLRHVVAEVLILGSVVGGHE